MPGISLRLRNYALPLLIFASFAAPPTWADKPGSGGGDKPGKHQQKEKGKHKDDGGNSAQGRKSHDVPVERSYFNDRHRKAVHDYYVERGRMGRCPPGLAKKHNGCMPPGQAKKWAMGQSLPADIVYYPVPAVVVTRLGTPPTGHKYVRVAGDILLIAVGTSMVVDAIQDLGGM